MPMLPFYSQFLFVCTILHGHDISLKCKILVLSPAGSPAGIHPEGAAAAGDETATTFSSIVLPVGRKLSRGMNPESPARHLLIQGKSTHECQTAIFTHRNIPKSVYTLLFEKLFYPVILK